MIGNDFEHSHEIKVFPKLYYSVFSFWTSVNLIFFTLASKKSGDVVWYEEQRNTSKTYVHVWAWHTPIQGMTIVFNDALLTLIGSFSVETSLFR